MPKKTTKKVIKPLAAKAADKKQVVSNTVTPKPVFAKRPAPWETASLPPMTAATAFEKPAAEVPVAPRKTATPKPKAVKVAFALDRSDAQRVTVCGEFNDWEPEATPLKRRDGGLWETTVALKPGRYQYKFVVDGQWLHDANARANVANEHGSLNSVVEVQA